MKRDGIKKRTLIAIAGGLLVDQSNSGELLEIESTNNNKPSNQQSRLQNADYLIQKPITNIRKLSGISSINQSNQLSAPNRKLIVED